MLQMFISHFSLALGLAELDRSSDAYPEVLADYAFALVRVDSPDDELKANAVENLGDFLNESTLAPLHIVRISCLMIRVYRGYPIR